MGWLVFILKGTTLCQKGSVVWRKMLEELVEDPQSWLESGLSLA